MLTTLQMSGLGINPMQGLGANPMASMNPFAAQQLPPQLSALAPTRQNLEQEVRALLLCHTQMQRYFLFRVGCGSVLFCSVPVAAVFFLL